MTYLHSCKKIIRFTICSSKCTNINDSRCSSVCMSTWSIWLQMSFPRTLQVLIWIILCWNCVLFISRFWAMASCIKFLRSHLWYHVSCVCLLLFYLSALCQFLHYNPLEESQHHFSSFITHIWQFNIKSFHIFSLSFILIFCWSVDTYNYHIIKLHFNL
jgi:hypothetical protein